MALLLALFFHNSLVQNVIIYLVDIWHYAIYWIILHKTVAYISHIYGNIYIYIYICIYIYIYI